MCARSAHFVRDFSVTIRSGWSLSTCFVGKVLNTRFTFRVFSRSSLKSKPLGYLLLGPWQGPWGPGQGLTEDGCDRTPKFQVLAGVTRTHEKLGFYHQFVHGNFPGKPLALSGGPRGHFMCDFSTKVKSGVKFTRIFSTEV